MYIHKSWVAAQFSGHTVWRRLQGTLLQRLLRPKYLCLLSKPFPGRLRYETNLVPMFQARETSTGVGQWGLRTPSKPFCCLGFPFFLFLTRCEFLDGITKIEGFQTWKDPQAGLPSSGTLSAGLFNCSNSQQQVNNFFSPSRL